MGKVQTCVNVSREEAQCQGKKSQEMKLGGNNVKIYHINRIATSIATTYNQTSMKTRGLLLLVAFLAVAESCNSFQQGLTDTLLPTSYHICPPGKFKLSEQNWAM